MKIPFSWKLGEMPKAGTVVWVRHDDQPLYWSYLPEGASRTDIERGFADRYDFVRRRAKERAEFRNELEREPPDGL